MRLDLCGVVRGGKITVDVPGEFAPDGTKMVLSLLKMSDQCGCVHVPGVIVDPGKPLTPRTRTRCGLPSGHDGDHSF